MTNTSDARGIYRSTSDAPRFDNISSAGSFVASVTAADFSFRIETLAGTGVDAFAGDSKERDGTAPINPPLSLR